MPFVFLEITEHLFQKTELISKLLSQSHRFPNTKILFKVWEVDSFKRRLVLCMTYDNLFVKVAGKDDETGEDLIQRDDDKPESVRNR